MTTPNFISITMEFLDLNEATTMKKVDKCGLGIQLFTWSMEIK